ncbi:hypothetical protein [Mycobacterium intracellulare]|uniref:hypothetical protein n=1 Tax=Mycobacterium intracellulare TaxID=1767 RepID=UPI00104267EE|nr:hypothetical protein [Mycobacterium intracellulare]
MAEAEREMEYVCGRLDMAEQAFYAVTNRGSGPSVHLMRELARIWGNVDYGVKELARNDEKGESEVLATCWDMQKNTRSSRTFIVPHQRMRGGARVELVDLTDIYLNNQNVGARAVRECIQTILPRWFTEKAQDICRRTLEHGEGEPLQDRINAMVAWFRDGFGVSEKQLEARIGKKRGAWSAEDVAQMKIAGKSIKAGEIGVSEIFPPIDAETVEDLVCAEDAAQAEATPKKTRVKAAKSPQVDESESTFTENRPEPENEQVSAPEAVDESAENIPENRPEDEPAESDPAPEPDPDPDVSPAAAAPGAPTESTPGRTERVEKALAGARKPSKARDALIDLIAACFREAGLETLDELPTVASSILKTRVQYAATLTDQQLKTVHTSLNAWKTVGTLADMVGRILDAADMNAEEAQQDAGQPPLDADQ